MRAYLSLAVTAALLWAGGLSQAASAQGAPAVLVGRWEAVGRSYGGIGQIIEFQANGTMIHWFAAMVDGAYRVEGARLVESFKDAATGRVDEITLEIRFEGSELVQRDPQSGSETRMTRTSAGSPKDPPIVGGWSFPHESGVTAFSMFTPDGRLIFRLPIRADRGRWYVSGDKLTSGLAAPGTTVRYELQGGRLTMTDEKGKQSTYVRAELLDFK